MDRNQPGPAIPRIAIPELANANRKALAEALRDLRGEAEASPSQGASPQPIPAPRILLPEALDPSTWARLRADPFGLSRLDALFADADAALSEPFPVLPFRSFMRFLREGERVEYEDLYFDRRRKLELFALAALASREGNPEPYLRALEDTIWAICDEFSWCLPAHLPAASLASVEPRAEESTDARLPPARRYVDLFAAETALALAEILGLLGERMAPELVGRARAEVAERVVDGFAEGGYRYEWEGATHNWAAVCAGGVGGAALWLIDDPSILAIILSRLGGAFESYLAGFPPDGACLEGMGYWSYGFGFFVAFSELLRERSSGRIDLLLSPGIADHVGEIARFPQRIRLVGEAVPSFSDASSPFRYPLGLLCRLERRLPGVFVPDFSLSEELAFDHARRWAKHVRDFAWFDPRSPSLERVEGQAAKATWLPHAQWAIFRSPVGDPPFAFAAKGGSNDEPHNHNDLGSFILAAGDAVLVDDFGAGRYDRDYFGPRRYEKFVTSSFGHSVPIIDGSGQAAGSGYRCRDARFEIQGEGEVEAEGLNCGFDLAGAYPLPRLLRLYRRFAARRSPPGLLLQDALLFSPSEEAPAGLALGSSPGADASGANPADQNPADANRARHTRHEIRERFVSLLPAAIEGADTAVIEAPACRLLIRAAVAPLRILLSSQGFEAHRGPPKSATIVDFVYESEAREMTLSFSFSFLKIISKHGAEKAVDFRG